MVKIVDYAERESADGDLFYALILEGDLRMAQSKETGQFYATTRKTSVPSTFSEEECEKMLGLDLPGKIVKQKCNPYDYVDSNTGEILTKEERWVFLSEDSVEVEAEQKSELELETAWNSS